jgi:hypothetical protein
MALSTNDILKVVVSIAFPESVVAQNVFWVLFENDGGSAAEDDVLDDLETWVEGIYANLLSKWDTETSLDELHAYVYDSSEDDFDEVGSRSLTGVGITALDFLPHGTAAVTNAKTANPDVQGRKFWGGFTEGANNNGAVDSATLTAIALADADWVTDFTGAQTGSGFDPGVYSLTKSTFYGFTGDTVLNTVWGYQRRRKPGVGI